MWQQARIPSQPKCGRERPLRILVLAIASACLACSGAGDTGLLESTEVELEDVAADASALRAGPNIVLITLDTLRADHLGAYGYGAIETPEIDRFAREGVRFAHATSPVPITLPAHSTVLTGQIPPRHGVRNNGAFLLGEGSLTLAEILRAQGYATGGFIGAYVLDKRFGTAQGFDFFTDFRGEAAQDSATPFLQTERIAEDVVAEAIGWIEVQSDPFLAWVHIYDPHGPHEPPEPYASQYPNRPYDGEIAYTDHAVGLLRRALEEMGHEQDTLWVILADHGEGLGDHDETWHAFFIYESTVHVPLIFWAPDSIPAGGVATGHVGLVDVLPTSLALLGIEDPEADSRDGIDLRPQFLAPLADGRPTYVESLVPLLDFGWSELRGLRADGWKYISAPRPELYDLSEDPGETQNLLETEPRRAAQMRAQLEEMVVDDDVVEVAMGQQIVDPETLQRLLSLGYLGGGSTPEQQRDVDPKDKIAIAEAFNETIGSVVKMVGEERWTEAERELEGLTNIAPNHFTVHFYIGKVALAQGRVERATASLEAALELNASYTNTYIELARAYEAGGQVERATDLLREAMRSEPEDFTFPINLGDLYQRQQRLAEAMEAYRAARRLAPEHPGLINRMANVYLMQGQPLVALEMLETATDRTPENPLIWGNLGTVLGSLGRFEEAEQAFRRGAELAPNMPRFQFNLGLVLLRQGKQTEAAASLRRSLELDPSFEDARLLLAEISGR
jgi:choline-sulfatase